ncbi:MAG: secretin N-terminal domain-containing protein [Acidobacteriota bacterium]
MKRSSTPKRSGLREARRSRAGVSLAILLLLVSLAGCTSYRSSRVAEIAADSGDWDEAVVQYMNAIEADPSNIRHRAALLRAKIRASQMHFERGKKYMNAEVWDRAMVELQEAVALDPTNQYAEAELMNVREILAARAAGRGATTLADLKAQNSGSRPQPPVLDPRSDEPISLNFPEPKSIFKIYRALGKAFGINVLFDPNLKDTEIPIELEDVTAQSALETLMRAAGHFYKVQDEHTIIIAADTPQNRRTYEDLVIQTFFLSNAEIKEMMTILRSLVDAKKIATNEQLNAIILRDTADKVKVAERIIEANDKAKAEVVIDVELMQLDTTSLRDLGVSLDPYSITQSLDTGTEGNTLRFSDIEFLNQNNWTLNIPNIIYRFIKQSSSAQLLARPQLRITEGEKARLVIGDRVPIPVTSFNTANTVGGNIVPITSFQYQEVGITIEIEPRVHHNKEVTLKVRVEVSNINGFIEGSGGQQQPRIGTRTIDSVIRLQDGETNFLAGLLRTDESSNESGVPGLSDIPVLGQLFSSRRADRNRTDVILTLTPHIVRNAEITEDDLLPIWVGTEANITFRGGSPRVESNIDGPFDDGSTPEELQEMMRRRIQRLPRGLREGQNQQEQQKEPLPQGIDLVPNPGGAFRPDESSDDDEDVPDGVPLQPQIDPFRGQAFLEAPARDLVASSGAGLDQVVTSFLAVEDQDAVGEAQGSATEAPWPAVWNPTPVQLRVSPRLIAVSPGDTFEMVVQANALMEVSHLPMALAFDPQVLEVKRVEAGDFLGRENEAEVLADTSQPGRIVIGASRLGEVPGVTGEGAVLRVVFRAIAEGPTRLELLDAEAMDSGLRKIQTGIFEAARIEVDSGAGPLPRRDPEIRERPRP